MSKHIKLETSSEEPSPRETQNIESLLQKLTIKVSPFPIQALRSAESVLDQNLLSSLHQKYEELAQKDKSTIEFLEFMLYSMLNFIDKMQQTC